MPSVTQSFPEPLSMSEFVPEETKPSKLGPTGNLDRIQTLDLLRGIALLGILVVNIKAMAMIGASYNNPTAYGNFQGSNFLVWLITDLFFESKMMAIFSMLFGAGIVLMSERVRARGGKEFWIHSRRMFWLLVFGLLHAHLIWFGDILFAYAICGMCVFFLRKWSATILVPLGVALILVPAALFAVFGVVFSNLDAAQIEEQAADWNPTAEVVAVEVDAYRGSWFEQLPVRSRTALMMETFVFAILFFWRAAGLMLVGMGLYKFGVLSGKRSNRFYVAGAVLGLTLGFIGSGYGIWKNVFEEFSFEYSMFFGVIPNYIGSLFVAGGYICLIALFARCNCLAWLKGALSSVGQMALTNYLMQSLICTTIFYGHGLGWFGYVSRTQQFGIVVCVLVLQLIWSPIWLSRFHFGPFEWLWRSLVYWQRQPMRKLEP